MCLVVRLVDGDGDDVFPPASTVLSDRAAAPNTTTRSERRTRSLRAVRRRRWGRWGRSPWPEEEEGEEDEEETRGSSSWRDIAVCMTKQRWGGEAGAEAVDLESGDLTMFVLTRKGDRKKNRT